MLTNEEYYLNEQGLMVFTEAYHLNRGYCCGNKCRHCPYDFKNVPEVSNKISTNKVIKNSGNEEE